MSDLAVVNNFKGYLNVSASRPITIIVVSNKFAPAEWKSENIEKNPWDFASDFLQCFNMFLGK